MNIAPLFGPPQPLIHLASLSLFRTGDQRAKPKFIGFKRYPSTHIATARLVLPISGTPNCSSRSALATKLEPGAYIPFHEHPEIKQALILECASRITMAGDYIQRKQVDCTIARRLGAPRCSPAGPLLPSASKPPASESIQHGRTTRKRSYRGYARLVFSFAVYARAEKAMTCTRDRVPRSSQCRLSLYPAQRSCRRSDQAACRQCGA